MSNGRISIQDLLSTIRTHAHCIQGVFDEAQLFNTKLRVNFFAYSSGAWHTPLIVLLPEDAVPHRNVSWILMTYLELTLGCLIEITSHVGPGLIHSTSNVAGGLENVLIAPLRGWSSWHSEIEWLRVCQDVSQDPRLTEWGSEVTKARSRTEKTIKRFGLKLKNWTREKEKIALVSESVRLPKDLIGVISAYNRIFCETCTRMFLSSLGI